MSFLLMVASRRPSLAVEGISTAWGSRGHERLEAHRFEEIVGEADEEDDDRRMQAKMKTSRAHASRLIRYEIREYSQWFPGKFNIIADSLSRDFHLSDTNLIAALRRYLGPQVPKEFRIVPLHVGAVLLGVRIAAWGWRSIPAVEVYPDRALMLSPHPLLL